MKTVRVKRLEPDTTLPTRAHPTDAGMDIYAWRTVKFSADDVVVIVPTKVAVEVPEGYVGLIRDRSSISKRGLKVTAGVIDCGYTGDPCVVFLNVSRSEGVVEKGSKIAQILLLPVATPEIVEVKELDETGRGSKGFGSSGS